MKRIFNYVFCLIMMVIFISCDNNITNNMNDEVKSDNNKDSEKIDISFLINDKIEIIKIDKGSTIDIAALSLDNGQNVELYLDAQYSKKYNGECIYTDTFIYVKNKIAVNDLIEIAKKDFFNQYDKELKFAHFYGEFDDALCFLMYGDPFDKSDMQVSYFIDSAVCIYRFVFMYHHEFSILMWKDGHFYDLSNVHDCFEVMNNSLLTYEDTETMYERHQEFLIKDKSN